MISNPTTLRNIGIKEPVRAAALLDKFWWISLYVTDESIAKLYVTKSLVK